MELQWKLLADRGRNEALYRALKKVIVKGKTTVSDIGSGTGYLSFLAAKLGAKECYLYECDREILAISKKLAVENGVKNCRFFEEHSARVKNPVKTDVVVCETLGNFALEENILETLNDAGKRFLKPGGMMIPYGLKQFVAPVTSERLSKETDIWNDVGFGLDFSTMGKLMLKNMYVSKIKPADILGRGAAANIRQWDKIDFRNNEKSVRKGRAEWKLKEPATIYGFAVWWEALLAPGVMLSTSPLSPPTHWDQIFLPLLSPLKAAKDATLNFEITSDSRYEVGISVEWSAHLHPLMNMLFQNSVKPLI